MDFCRADAVTVLKPTDPQQLQILKNVPNGALELRTLNLARNSPKVQFVE